MAAGCSYGCVGVCKSWYAYCMRPLGLVLFGLIYFLVSHVKGAGQTVLYCTVLYCTVLYCTVLYCTVLYCTVLYCTVLYCMTVGYGQLVTVMVLHETLTQLFPLCIVFC